MDTLHEDLCTFMVICDSILLRMRNASIRLCREDLNTHCMFNKFVITENRTVHEIMCKNMVEL